MKSNATQKNIPLPRHPIDEIMADIGVYQNPDILLEEYQVHLATQNPNVKNLEVYYALLSNVRYAWHKTLRYESYFENFYPINEKVEEIEALNHHIHSYLEDMDIFKEKLDVLFGKMKNDVKSVATNKTEVVEFYKAAVDKNFEVFNGISEHRNPHHHGGMRFIDADLLKAENARNGRLMFQSEPFAGMIRPEKIDAFIEKLKNEEGESFSTAKTK